MDRAENLTNEEFALASVEAHINNELFGENESRMIEILATEEYQDLPENFAKAKGLFQIRVSELHLGETEIHDLRQIVEEDTDRVQRETSKIDRLGKSEVLGRALRRVVFLGGLLLVGGGTVLYLTPAAKPTFDPLEVLVYEAIAMGEDTEGRLDFLSSDINETLDFIKSYPELGFEVPQLKPPSNGWVTEGGAVIDYEVAKIAAIQFHNLGQDQKVFQFIFRGSLDELPKTEIGNFGGMLYHTYASDRVNVVIWKADEAQGLLGMIIGTLGAKDLAEIAKTISR